MKILSTLFLLYSFSFSSSIQEDIWWKGESLITFLTKHQISQDIYFNLSKIDKELCSEINAGVKYQILYDENYKIQHILIPISEQMQIHIFKKHQHQFALNIIPINYKEVVQTILIPINYSPYQDIILKTNNKELANEFTRAFKTSVNFSKIQKNDILAIKYIQKIRLGKYFGIPTIVAAKIEVNKKAYYVFQYKNDKRYYDFKGRSLTSFFLKRPLKYNRVSSRFTYKRWHPILKRYTAHLGIDFAAPTGRKIFSAADGKIIYKGRKGGYGKTIIIQHKGGYKSLYAHMSRYGGVRKGQSIRQGRYIGNVGSTGRSTGPHLHFGLYKNGRAINPSSILSVTKVKLKGKKKKRFIAYAKKLKNELDTLVPENTIYQKINAFKSSYKLYTRENAL